MRKCHQPPADRKSSRYYHVIRHRLQSLCVGCATVVVVLIVVTSSYGNRRSTDRSSLIRSSNVGLVAVDGLSTGLRTGDSKTIRYVSLCTDLPLMTIRRTGNHLFMLAATMYLAERTNRTVLMPLAGWPLDEWFQTDSIERYINKYPCPCLTLRPWTRLETRISGYLIKSSDVSMRVGKKCHPHHVFAQNCSIIKH